MFIRVYANIRLGRNMSEGRSKYQGFFDRKSEPPGITELMIVYGRYEEFIHQTRQYFEAMKPKFVLSTINSSTPG